MASSSLPSSRSLTSTIPSAFASLHALFETIPYAAGECRSGTRGSVICGSEVHTPAFWLQRRLPACFSA